ncbi:hypothetical protein [Phaeodactylibacter xiamenensis]|uniref:hypothetical protein n=1 Tax=Phaeodactylibacter xiamenensis TaxID=1524460 RepID=UPI0024A88F96|nr:hypothetical protein [Phaeodactylibacter xiamenensis]
MKKIKQCPVCTSTKGFSLTEQVVSQYTIDIDFEGRIKDMDCKVDLTPSRFVRCLECSHQMDIEQVRAQVSKAR